MSSKALKIGIIMDPIGSITPRKDSSFAMLLEASRRNAEIHYFEQRDLRILSGVASGVSRRLSVQDNNDHWFEFGAQQDLDLGDLDVILMRKDPPFDMEYVYTTYILDRAQQAGALIVNAPQALRNMNEKAYTAWFPECTPITLITRSMAEMKTFLGEHRRIVVKPLDGMGGRSIFVIQVGDNNANVIFETLTDYGQRFAMAQVYIPEIRDGDKRILIIDDEPSILQIIEQHLEAEGYAAGQRIPPRGGNPRGRAGDGKRLRGTAREGPEGSRGTQEQEGHQGQGRWPRRRPAGA